MQSKKSTPIQIDFLVQFSRLMASQSKSGGYIGAASADRFHTFTPESREKGDVAFTQNVISALGPKGRAAVIVSRKSLFEDGSNVIDRQRIVETGSLEAVVGLPAGVFYDGDGENSACILVLSNIDAQSRSNVLFINSSSLGFIELQAEFGSSKVVNTEEVEKIAGTYHARIVERGYSELSSFDEIKLSNWNIEPRMHVMHQG